MKEKICLTCGNIIREVIEPICPIKTDIEEFKDIYMCKECNDYLNECPHILAETIFTEIRWMSEKKKRLELFLDQMVEKRLLGLARREEMNRENL